MLDKKYTIAIIGGGPAGIAAALEAATYSDSVLLVSQEKPGGRALWHSLTPSKVWLHAAGNKQYQADKILEYLQAVKSWQDEAYSNSLKSAKIDVLEGRAQFLDQHTIAVDDDGNGSQTIKADFFVVASGSVPVFPDTLKPDGKRIIAPKLLGKLHTIPKSIIIVGGGVTGAEMMYLFSQLGSQVTVVTDMPTLLPRVDVEVSNALEDYFKSRDVTVHTKVKAESIKNEGEAVHVRLHDGQHLTAEYAFVAIGRAADVSALNLLAAGIEANGGIQVNYHCRTNIPSIYAVGDVTGAPMTANRAMAMGRLAAKNALSGESEELNENWIVEAVYTEPEVAQVGYTSGQSKIYKADFSSNVKAHISGADAGFIKLFVDKNDVIVGASGIGSHVSDLIYSAALAVRSKMTLREFQHVVPANPTLSELFANLKKV